MTLNFNTEKLLGQLQGVERETLVEDIKPQFFALKKNGASRQLQALEKLLGLPATGTSGKNEHSSGQSDANSVAPTPSLTNETNSPLSSSPPSTHVSAVGMPSDDGAKHLSSNGGDDAAIRVRDIEA